MADQLVPANTERNVLQIFKKIGETFRSVENTYVYRINIWKHSKLVLGPRIGAYFINAGNGSYIEIVFWIADISYENPLKSIFIPCDKSKFLQQNDINLIQLY